MAIRLSRMPPEEREWVGRCLRHPDTDQVRLEYSDWLEENGQHNQAQLICAHVAWARFPRTDRGRATLRRLLGEGDHLDDSWLDGLPALAGVYLYPVRGLPQRLLVTDEYDGDARLGEYFQELPLLSDLAVYDCPHLPRLLGWAASAPLAALKIEDGPGRAPVRNRARALAAAAHLGSLAALEFVGCRALVTVLNKGAPAVAGAAKLKVLLSVTEATLAGLARAPRRRPLLELDLSTNGLGDAAVDILVGWEGLADLRRLVLDANWISAAAARRLVGGAFRGSLQSLSMVGTGASAAGRGGPSAGTSTRSASGTRAEPGRHPTAPTRGPMTGARSAPGRDRRPGPGWTRGEHRGAPPTGGTNIATGPRRQVVGPLGLRRNDGRLQELHAATPVTGNRPPWAPMAHVGWHPRLQNPCVEGLAHKRPVAVLNSSRRGRRPAGTGRPRVRRRPPWVLRGDPRRRDGIGPAGDRCGCAGAGRMPNPVG